MTVLENAKVGQHTRTKAGLFGALPMELGHNEEEMITEKARAALAFFGDRLWSQREIRWRRAWRTPIGGGWKLLGRWPQSPSSSYSTNRPPA